MNFEAVSCPLCGCEDARPLLQVLARRMVRCQRCSLIYRNPRPMAKDITLAYTVGQTAPLREERVGERRSHHFRRFLRSAGQPGRLLDIGCGYGFFLKLAQEAGWETIGVDLDPQAVAYANNRFQVKALWGDLRNFRFPEGSFDLVTLWNTLDYVPDPLDLLKEAHRVLKPGGHVFIRIPNTAWHLLSFRLTGLLKRLGWGTVFDERPYLTFVFNLTNFSHSTLRLLLERTGFVSVSIRNSLPIQGDPYLGLRPGGEWLISLAKFAMYGMAQGVAFLSRGHLIIGPSLEAWGQRVTNP